MTTVLQRIFAPFLRTAPVAHLSVTTAPTLVPQTSSTYAERTALLGTQYDGTAEWGTPIARNVVDMRAAFILGAGVQVAARDGARADRELEFVQAFMKHNGFSEDTAQDWAKEAEIEGKFCAVLRPSDDSKAAQVSARYLNWTQRKYKVATKPDDYAVYRSVTYNDSSGVEVKLNESQFVYRPFGGRTHNVNDTPSKAACVTECFTAIHKALVDWRKANKLFGSPTPYFKCGNRSEAEALLALLAKMQWKVGQFLAGTAEYSLVGMPGQGIDSIKDEIVINAQLISGNTGIPVHFLGFPSLMSNRSTADTLFDLITASVQRERRIWEAFYYELFDKAIAIANETYKLGLEPGLVVAHIPELSTKSMAELKDTWLPLYEASAVSLETLLKKIPLLDDPDEELKRLREAQADAAVEAMKALKASADQGGSNRKPGGNPISTGVGAQ